MQQRTDRLILRIAPWRTHDLTQFAREQGVELVLAEGCIGGVQACLLVVKLFNEFGACLFAGLGVPGLRGVRQRCARHDEKELAPIHVALSADSQPPEPAAMELGRCSQATRSRSEPSLHFAVGDFSTIRPAGLTESGTSSPRVPVAIRNDAASRIAAASAAVTSTTGVLIVARSRC